MHLETIYLCVWICIYTYVCVFNKCIIYAVQLNIWNYLDCRKEQSNPNPAELTHVAGEGNNVFGEGPFEQGFFLGRLVGFPYLAEKYPNAPAIPKTHLLFFLSSPIPTKATRFPFQYHHCLQG